MSIVDIMNVLVSEGTVLDVVISSVSRNMTPDEIMTGFDAHQQALVDAQDEDEHEHSDDANPEWVNYFISSKELADIEGIGLHNS